MSTDYIIKLFVPTLTNIDNTDSDISLFDKQIKKSKIIV